MMRSGKGRSSRELTFWLRSWRPGDREGQGVDGDSADDEGDESGFGEHDYRERREKEQITTAPGLWLWR